MKKIYSANNLMEAQIVLDLLEHAYIPARIFNQNAISAANTSSQPASCTVRHAMKKIRPIFSCVGNAEMDWRLLDTATLRKTLNHSASKMRQGG